MKERTPSQIRDFADGDILVSWEIYHEPDGFFHRLVVVTNTSGEAKKYTGEWATAKQMATVGEKGAQVCYAVCTWGFEGDFGAFPGLFAEEPFKISRLPKK